MTLGRRERVRAATMAEITQTARRILVEEGPEALTLRAIAREMGMTAPALYRYFPSRGELLQHLVGELFVELNEELHRGIKAVPPGDMRSKFMAAGTGFRSWALAHKREYALLFGNPFPTMDDVDKPDFASESGNRFGLTFLHLFAELWNKHPFPIAEEDAIEPRLRDQLAAYRDSVAPDLPLGCVLAFLQCWVRLYGAVSLEVFGHVDFALQDPEPLFNLMITEVAANLGLA